MDKRTSDALILFLIELSMIISLRILPTNLFINYKGFTFSFFVYKYKRPFYI